jgi:hypothetical protein
VAQEEADGWGNGSGSAAMITDEQNERLKILLSRISEVPDSISLRLPVRLSHTNLDLGSRPSAK